ncbi:MAG: hypothetical protein HIU57_00450 [Acidobacteria bacterium]|nr:hypothetical protein [Acidobacteriota bacterium]
MTSLRRAFVIVCCALCLSSCTLVSTSSSPSLIGAAAVPLGLLQPTIPFTDYAQVRWVTRSIFLIDRAEHIVAVARLMTAPASLFALLYYETQGPDPIELANGITTQVPTTMVVNQATIHDGVALIDVSKALTQISLDAQRVAVGQLVFAAASMGATRGIRISINQSPYTLKLPTGALATLITPADVAYLKKG